MITAKQKLINILSGWKNYLFESEEIEAMAKHRAIYCATCDNAVWGLVPSLIGDNIQEIKGMICNGCETKIKCPLSAKLRSPDENCPKELWKAK